MLRAQDIPTNGSPSRGSRSRCLLAAFTLALAAGLLASLPARAQTSYVGVAESYEGYPNASSGIWDNRGQNRYDRLGELLQSWESLGVAFGVLNGDNIANVEASWPLLESVLLATTTPVYLVAGNHDYVNQEQADGSPHPASCQNVPVAEQTTACPNFVYLTDHLQSRFGIATPWYAIEHSGTQFVFLADDRWDSRSGGDSDVSTLQFEWFRDFVETHSDSPIVVFAHHPVYRTVAGSLSATSTRNRLGWRPKMGEYPEDGTANLTNGSPVVELVGTTVDPKRVAAGTEFQRDIDSRWYTIASASGTQIILTEPYEGPTESSAPYLAGGHWNALNEIFMDETNSIELVLSGHTGGDFRTIGSGGAAQLEVIAGKTFAYSGSLSPDYDWGGEVTFHDGSTTAELDVSYPLAHSYGLDSRIRFGGTWHDIESISLPGEYGELASLELDSPANTPGGVDYTGGPLVHGVDERTESRMIEVIPGGDPTVHAWNFETSRAISDLVPLPVGTTSTWLGGSATATPSRTLLGEPLWGHYEVQVDMDHPVGGSGGLIFRAVDGENYYAFEVDDEEGVFRFSRIEQGQPQAVTEVDLPSSLPAIWALEVNARADRLRLIANGVLVVDLEDPTFPNGMIGMTAQGGPPDGYAFTSFRAYGDEAPIGVPEAGPIGAATALTLGFSALLCSPRRARRRGERSADGAPGLPETLRRDPEPAPLG